MAKKEIKFAPTVDTLKPYLERALSDSEFRDDLKEALSAARKLYGPLAKEAARGNGIKSASRLATDAKVQENLRKALEDFGKAAETLKGKKKSHKARKTMLLAGLVAGALYNPWTGPTTRQWLLDKIAGDDDLQPLEGFDVQSGNGDEAASSIAEEAANGGKAAKAAAAEAKGDAS